MPQGAKQQSETDRDEAISKALGLTSGASGFAALLGIPVAEYVRKQILGKDVLKQMEDARVGKKLLSTGAGKLADVKKPREGWNENSRSQGKSVGTEVDLPRTTDGKVPKPQPPVQGPSYGGTSKGGPGVKTGPGGTTTLSNADTKPATAAGSPTAASKPRTQQITTRSQIRKSATDSALQKMIEEEIQKQIDRLTEVAGNITRPAQTAIDPKAVDKSVNRQRIKAEEAAGRAAVEKARQEQPAKVAEAQANVDKVKADLAPTVSGLQAKADAARPGAVQSVEDLTLAKLNAGIPKNPTEAAQDVMGIFAQRIADAGPERRKLVKERNKYVADNKLAESPIDPESVLGPKPTLGKRPTKQARELAAKWDADAADIIAENNRVKTGVDARQAQIDALNKQIEALDVMVTPSGKPQPSKSGPLSYTPGMDDLFGIGRPNGRPFISAPTVAGAASEFFKPGVGLRPPQYSPETQYPNGYDPVSGKPFAPAQNTYTGAGRDAGVSQAQGAFDQNMGAYGAAGSQLNKATYPLQNANQQLYAAQNPIPPYRQPMGDGSQPVFRMWPDPTDPSAMRSSFDPMPVKIPIGEFDPGRDPYAALSLADPGMQGPRPGTGSALGAPGPLPNAGPSRVSIQDVIDPGGIQRTLDTFSRTANSLQPDYGIKQTATNLQKLLEAEAVKKKKLGGGAPKKSLVERVIDMLQGGALSPTDLQRMNSGVDSAADNYTAVKDFAKTNKRAPDLSNADDMALLKAGGYVAPQVGSQGSLISNAAVDTPAVGYSGPRTRLGMNAAAADAVGTLGITKGPLGKTWNPDITPGKPNIGRLVKGGTIGSGLVGLGVAGYNMYEGYKTEREAKAESDRLKAVKDASIGQKMSIYDRSRNAWTQHVMRGDNYKKSGDNLLRTLTRDFLNSGKLETLSPEEWKQVQSHWATFAKDKR